MTDTDATWELEARPVKMRQWVVAGALVVLTIHVVAAVVLRGGGDSGVNLRPVDQVAILTIGIVLSGGVLLFTRPRMRVGAEGVFVRNVIVERHISWNEVRGLYYDHGAPWARLELPYDEYVPVVAIQARDGEKAVTALEGFRELEARYGIAGSHDGGAVEGDNGGAVGASD